MANKPRLLLLSNSTMAGTKYLEYARPVIERFLADRVSSILFIPFAAISITWDDYHRRVEEALPNYTVVNIDTAEDILKAVAQAEAIVIGGGNTFNLLKHLHEKQLIDAIRRRVVDGVPYIGWSAGANVASPDIGSTNDMPVVWPPTDTALNLVPFNINPHYDCWKPMGYQGEGRDDRLNECVVARRRPILAISEGLAVLVEEGRWQLMAPELPTGCDNKQRCAKIWLPDQQHKDGCRVIDAPVDGDIRPLVGKWC